VRHRPVPGGTTLVEVEPPGVDTKVLEVRVELGTRCSTWFPWAIVGADGLPGVAAAAGLDVTSLWAAGGRWFAQLS
jgi:hypothetical protein